MSAATLAGVGWGVVTVIVLSLVLWGTSLSGDFVDGHDFVGWPLPVVDAWSLLSDVSRLLLVSWLLAWFVRLSVWTLGGDADVRVWPIVIAIAAGWVTVFTWAILPALALIVIVVRRIAFRSSRRTRRSSRRRARAVLAVVALLTFATVSYHPLHPLSTLTALDDGLWQTPRAASISHTQEGSSIEFKLRNDGIARVTLRGLTVHPQRARAQGTGSRAALFEATGAAPEDYSSGAGPGRPIAGTVLQQGEELLVDISRSPRACPADGTVFTVNSIAVHFQTLGTSGTQQFELHPPALVTCPVR